jgi:hypothetical protein
MKLKEIIAIPGAPGLYKHIATGKNNIIVESLQDGKRQSVGATKGFSSLGDIAVYTKDEDLPLADVMKKMKDNAGTAPDGKAEPEEMKKYFRTLIPEIDEDRVHISHMKKILTWYDLLKDKVDFTKLDEEESGDNPSLPQDSDKPQHGTKQHEGHAPKAEKHAKVAPVKLRKKV